MKGIVSGIKKSILFLGILSNIILLANPLVYAGWTVVSPPNVSSNWHFTGVHFTSSSEGWAVGRDLQNARGVLLHYLDGSWNVLDPPYVSSNWYLNKVHFTSPGEGWAVGIDLSNSRAVLLHYLDGSWTNVSLPMLGTPERLFDVYFTSPSEGWAVGGGWEATLLHYLNGSWLDVNPPKLSSDWHLGGTHFTSPSEGWAVGVDFSNGNGVLLHYLNGLWKANTPPNISSYWYLNGVHFTSSGEGWAVGIDQANMEYILLHYTDALWARIISPDISSRCYLARTHFTSASEGWAVGEDNAFSENAKGVLLHYLDGSWTMVQRPEVGSRWFVSDVHFISPHEGWAVGGAVIDVNNRIGVLLSYSPPYTLTINVTGSGNVTKNPDKSTYNEGEQVSLTASPDPGYSFSHWSGDIRSSTNPSVLTMNGDRSVTANFTQNQYTLTAVSNSSCSGLVIKTPDKTSYVYGETVQLKATANPGYVFSAWSGDASGSANPAMTAISGNMTVIANFNTGASPAPGQGQWKMRFLTETGETITTTQAVVGYSFTNGEEAALTMILYGPMNFIPTCPDIGISHVSGGNCTLQGDGSVTARAGQTFSFRVGSQTSGATLSALYLPLNSGGSSATFDPLSGVFQWSTSADDIGKYLAEFQSEVGGNISRTVVLITIVP